MRAAMRWGSLPVALLTAGTLATSAGAAPGPELHEPQARLDGALRCSPDVDAAKRTPVLLVPGTSASPENDYGWNYMKVLPRAGYPVCTLTYRDRGMIDLQIQVEYVVNAIRSVAARSGRKIAVIGHSQGAILNSYALRFWPDLARKVEDFIGVAGTYTYGSDLGRVVCAPGCPPPFHQATAGSPFMAAIARTPLPPGPGYTAYLSLTDELIQPQPKAGTLDAPGARTYTLQDLCPADPYEHDLIVATAATVALTLDALSHPGPADVARLTNMPCGLVPEAANIARQLPDFALGQASATTHTTTHAPPLRCYLDPACPKPRLQPTLIARTTRWHKRRAALATAGMLVLPEGALRRCTGNVTVTIRQGHRTIRRSTATLAPGTTPTSPDCRFTARTNLPHRTTGVLRVVTRFGGSGELLRAAARPQTLRADRRPVGRARPTRSTTPQPGAEISRGA